MSGDCEFRFSTLSERTLHRAVKDYLEPDRQYQEVPVAGFVADIFRDGQLLEVQTGSVTPLVKKLLRLPKEYPVTIVLPIVREKTLVTPVGRGGAALPGPLLPEKERLVGGLLPAAPAAARWQSVRVCGCG